MKQMKVKRDVISPSKSMMERLYTFIWSFSPEISRSQIVLNVLPIAAAPVTPSCFHRTDKKNRPSPH